MLRDVARHWDCPRTNSDHNHLQVVKELRSTARRPLFELPETVRMRAGDLGGQV